MRLVALLLSAAPLFGQISGLQVAGVTSTQAVLVYEAPNEEPCTLEVSESPIFQPLVNDVNESLFPGASSDSRSLTRGKQRIVVIGKRRAEKAQDGKLYSRALAADTPHYVRVRCGAYAASAQFTTRTVPWGDSFPEPPPFHPDGFGNYGWPTIDWTDRNREYVDPMTGVKLKLLGSPGMRGNRFSALFGSDFWWDWSGNKWVNPQNSVSGRVDSLAQVSDPTAVLFVGLDPLRTTLPYGELIAGWSFNRTVDDLGVQVFGSGTDSAAENRAIKLCLSLDSGQSCAGEEIQVVLPHGTPQDAGVHPPSFPKPMYASWGARPLGRWEWPRAGLVTVSGSNVQLVASHTGGAITDGAVFDTRWVPGTKIWISGSHPACPHNLCTLVRVDSPTSLFIQENLSLASPTAYRSANLGFRVRKATSTGTVSVSLSHVVAWSYVTWPTFGGNDDRCSRVAVTASVDREGKPTQPQKGYLCILPLPIANDAGAPVVWVGEETGEVRLISLMKKPATIPGHNWEDLPYGPAADPGGIFTAFDPDLGNVWYVSLLVNGTDASGQRKRSVFRLTYTGDYREYKPNYPQSFGDDLSNAPLDNVAWENITKASQKRDIQSQIESTIPTYNRQLYGNVGLNSFAVRDAAGRYMVIVHNMGFQDGPCWMFFLDLKTGLLAKGFNSWDGEYHPSLRWGGCHAGQASGPEGFAFLSHVPLRLFNPNSLYGGPFEVEVTAVRRSGQWSPDTAVPANPDGSYDAACPADLPEQWKKQGAVGDNCLWIRTRGEPCSNWASTAEKAASPCPWDANRSMLQQVREGDVAYDRNAALAVDSERFRVVRKTTLPDGQLELVLHRKALSGDFCGELPNQRVHSRGWSITMGIDDGCEEAVRFINAAPATNEVVTANPKTVRGHNDFGVGRDAGTYRLVGPGTGRSSGPVSGVTQPPDLFWNVHVPFHGVVGLQQGLQSYPSLRQWNAQGAERYWMLDFHHTEAPGSLSLLRVTGTNNVYRMNVLGATVEPKILPLFVYAGQYLFRDKSGPESLLTDQDTWRYCYARKAGECRPDSSPGQLYISAPYIESTARCPEVHYSSFRLYPCAFSGVATAAAVIQRELELSKGSAFRKLTMGFSGPMRQFAFANSRALPNGKWAIVPGYWLDGVRSDLLLMRLPRSEPFDSNNRTRFRDVLVRIGPAQGVTHAVVDFGYEEYGKPEDFFCTSRAERCTVPGLEPFSYESEKIDPMPCSEGCSIKVPALSSRVLYYRVRYLNSSGETVLSGPIQVLAVD